MTFHPVVPTIGNIPSPLPIANGGTNAITAAAARTSLGVAYDATAGDFQPVGTAAAGSNGLVSDSGHVHPVGYAEQGFTPADCGILAWNFDVDLVSSSSAPTLSNVNLARVNIRQAISVTNVLLGVGIIGSGLTSSQNLAGLYAGQTVGPYTAGQLIGTSADQTAAWGSTGLKTAALVSGPFPIPAGTFVWVAFVTNASTTAPSFARGASQTASIPNLGFAAATARHAANGTATTALPGSITPGSNVLSGIGFWAALS